MLPEPKKEKHTKLEAKPQPRTSSRKPSSSPSKKEKSSAAPASVPAGDPAEPAEAQAASEEGGSPHKCQPFSRGGHDRKVFQRTLSPADVLHVHSYAKGDYGDGENQSKEEKSDSSETRTDRDKRLSRVRPMSVTPAPAQGPGACGATANPGSVPSAPGRRGSRHGAAGGPRSAARSPPSPQGRDERRRSVPSQHGMSMNIPGQMCGTNNSHLSRNKDQSCSQAVSTVASVIIVFIK